MSGIERFDAPGPGMDPAEEFAGVGPDGALVWWTAGFARRWPAAPVPPLRVADPTIWSEEFLAVVRAGRTGSGGTGPRRLRFSRIVRGGSEIGDDPEVDLIPVPGSGGAGAGLLLKVRPDDRGDEGKLREELFYAAYRTSSNPMEITDVQGTLLDVNPAFERVYGYSPAECRGRKPSLVRSHHTSPGLYEAMWAALTDPTVGHWAGELVNRDRWGGEHPVLLSIAAIRDRQGEIRYYLGVTEDLTERRAWEVGAIRADRLASLGQLSAGVAHELNTPLANISLLAESLRRRVDLPEVRARVESIQAQVEEAGRIVRGLLDFARVTPTSLRRVDLKAAVHEAVALVEGMRSADVEIQVRLPDEPMGVLADRGQIVQVLTNLLHNAYDAMGDAGRIEIEGRADDSRAEITVADSGPGIPDQDLPRIFEPFFTTKQDGEGTGLGLAVSFRIMAAHHGAIVATNRPTGGACFRITLPRGSGGIDGPSPLREPAVRPDPGAGPAPERRAQRGDVGDDRPAPSAP
ncbi:MAG: sensor histidine kinase [Thermoplasmata archaeon]